MKITIEINNKSCHNRNRICPFLLYGIKSYCLYFKRALDRNKERLIANRCQSCLNLDKKGE